MYDTHVHLATTEWVEDCVGIYARSVADYFRVEMDVEPLEKMTARYVELGMKAVLLGWDAERNTGQPPLTSERIAQIQRLYPDVYLGFGSVDPHRFDAVERVAAIAELGLHGFKFHPSVQGFDPLDPALDDVFEAVGATGLPLVVHAGMSGLGARQPGGQGLRLDVADPIRWDAFAARYPETKVMIAHLGVPWLDQALAMATHKTNVFLDISGWKVKHLPPSVISEMSRRLSSQIVFGSDFPMFDPKGLLHDLKALDLPAGVLERLTVSNAERFLGLA